MILAHEAISIYTVLKQACGFQEGKAIGIFHTQTDDLLVLPYVTTSNAVFTQIRKCFVLCLHVRFSSDDSKRKS